MAVDRGETHVGHLVERRQGVHHQLADQLGGNLRLARRFQTAGDAVHHPLDALRVDLTLLQRQRHGAQQLVARSEEHTSELQSLMRNSYAVFCLKKKKRKQTHTLYNSKISTATHNITN